MKKDMMVADFISDSIRKCGKTQRQITGEVGFLSLNMMTMLKQGLTKVPLHKVGPIAEALEVDPLYLFSLVMKEYYPETYDSLSPILQGLKLSEEEMRFLRAFRKMQDDERRVIKS